MCDSTVQVWFEIDNTGDVVIISQVLKLQISSFWYLLCLHIDSLCTQPPLLSPKTGRIKLVVHSKLAIGVNVRTAVIGCSLHVTLKRTEPETAGEEINTKLCH